jgi:hypothetical protein
VLARGRYVRKRVVPRVSGVLSAWRFVPKASIREIVSTDAETKKLDFYQ